MLANSFELRFLHNPKQDKSRHMPDVSTHTMYKHAHIVVNANCLTMSKTYNAVSTSTPYNTFNLYLCTCFYAMHMSITLFKVSLVLSSFAVVPKEFLLNSWYSLVNSGAELSWHRWLGCE